MKNTKESPQTSQQLLDKLQALVAEAETILSDSGSAENTADPLGRVREHFNVARERLGDFYDKARARVVSGAKSTDSTIRTNPYQSLAIAAGVGLLVGVLLGRRKV